MQRSARSSVERLTLATITAVPEWHPEHTTFTPFPVHAWIVRHPDGVVLFDTGVGLGNDVIDDWYRPSVTPLADALRGAGLTPADIDAVVLSHLHFDHCGQHASLDAPVYVQRAEVEAAQAEFYTVPAWAAIEPTRLRLLDGDATIAAGVRVLATPGHTPGHQSLVVDTGGRRVVLGGQCAFRAAEIESGEPASSNLHGDAWRDEARESLARVRALKPAYVHLSHDRAITAL